MRTPMQREVFTQLLRRLVENSGISKSDLAAQLTISPAESSGCSSGATQNI